MLSSYLNYKMKDTIHVSGRTHDTEIHALIAGVNEIPARELRQITATRGMIGSFIKDFFKRAKAQAELGQNFVYLEAPNDDAKRFAEEYLGKLGYSFSCKCKNGRPERIATW